MRHTIVTCKINRHPLYLCSTKFKLLPVLKHFETIKNTKFCYNCLRSHRRSACIWIARFVRSITILLHIDEYPKASATNTKSTTKTELVQTEWQFETIDTNDESRYITHTFMLQLMTNTLIYIRDNGHRLIKYRALLNMGANFISVSIAKHLNMWIHNRYQSVQSIGQEPSSKENFENERRNSDKNTFHLWRFLQRFNMSDDFGDY